MALPNIEEMTKGVLEGGNILGVSNALTNNAFNQRINRAKADYAPYTEYANAASHIAYANMLPYQIQATVMSNPMLWAAYKDRPQDLQRMVNNMVNSIPQGGNVFGNIKLPVPGQQQRGGILNFLGNLFHGQSSHPQQQFQQQRSPMNNNAEGNQPSGGNMATPGQVRYISQYGNSGIKNGQIPELTEDGRVLPPPAQTAPPSSSDGNTTGTLSPAREGNIQGLIGEKTVKSSEQPYTPGAVATIRGKNVSVPAGSTVADVQRSYVGIKTALPTLKEIEEGAEEFLKPGVAGQMLATKINGLVQQFGGFNLVPKVAREAIGIDDEKYSRYARWLSQIEQAPESLMRAFDMPKDQEALKKVAAIIDPTGGEMGPGYKKRVLKEIASLTETRMPLYENILNSGIPLEPTKSKPEIKNNINKKSGNKTVLMSGPDPKDNGRIKNWNVPENMVDIYKLNKFKIVGKPK